MPGRATVTVVPATKNAPIDPARLACAGFHARIVEGVWSIKPAKPVP